MKKGILIRQRDITDCGAACLASVAAHYKLRVPISRIRQIAGTDRKGTSALGLIEAAEKLHFSAKGVKGKTEVLPRVPIPAIAHVIINKNLHHYVVIYKVNKKTVKIMDPAKGKMISCSTGKFAEIWTGVLILLLPGNDFIPEKETVSIESRIGYLLKPHTSVLVQALLGAALYTLIGLSLAIYVQKIIDNVLPRFNYNLLNLLSVAMIILLIIQVILNVFKSIFILKTGQQIDAKLILGYYNHLLTLPQRFFDSMRTGEIISRINDAVKIRNFINESGIGILINFFILIFSFGLMFTYYWKLALIMLLIIPFYSLIFWLSDLFNRKVERKVMEKAAELESQMVESIHGIKTIKVFGMRKYIQLKTETRFVDLLRFVYKSGMNNIFTGDASFMISRLFTIILLWTGAGFAMEQVITPGELMSFYAILGYFTTPAGSLIGANKLYQNARIAADRLFEIMDLEGYSAENKLELSGEGTGDIRFEQVTFRYGTRVTVFEDLNLTMKSGEITAIIGESGSGKSTIAAMLKRLYPVESGKIFIGSYDLNFINEESLRCIMGIVPQHIDLFAGTILENIALGEINPDTKRILKLSAKLGMNDFINGLPDGIFTYLGENGMNLSGGQRQRLAILRMLYPDPEIVIFDEATSALDPETEKAIILTMQELRDRGKTVILISHRLHTTALADQIIILDNGKVVGQGNHHDLLNSSDKYGKIWKRYNGNHI